MGQATRKVPVSTGVTPQLIEAFMDRENKVSRKHLKLVILINTPKRRVQPVFIKEYGLAAGVLLAHFFRWDSLGSDENGWIYQSREQLMGIEKGTGMPDRQIRNARKTLVDAGALEEDLRKGIPKRMFYRVNLAKVLELVAPDVFRELAELESAYHADEEACPECGSTGGCDERCFLIVRDEDEEEGGWIRGEPIPPLTDDDAPEEAPEPEWLPDDFEPTLNLDSNWSTGEPINGSDGEPINGSTGEPDKQIVTSEGSSDNSTPSGHSPPSASLAAHDFKEPEEPETTSPPSSPAPPLTGQRNGSDTTALTSQDSPVREKASTEGDGASGSPPTSEPSRTEMWMRLVASGASEEELLDFEREAVA